MIYTYIKCSPLASIHRTPCLAVESAECMSNFRSDNHGPLQKKKIVDEIARRLFFITEDSFNNFCSS